VLHRVEKRCKAQFIPLGTSFVNKGLEILLIAASELDLIKAKNVKNNCAKVNLGIEKLTELPDQDVAI